MFDDIIYHIAMFMDVPSLIRLKQTNKVWCERVGKILSTSSAIKKSLLLSWKNTDEILKKHYKIIRMDFKIMNSLIHIKFISDLGLETFIQYDKNLNIFVFVGMSISKNFFHLSQFQVGYMIDDHLFSCKILVTKNEKNDQFHEISFANNLMVYTFKIDLNSKPIPSISSFAQTIDKFLQVGAIFGPTKALWKNKTITLLQKSTFQSEPMIMIETKSDSTQPSMRSELFRVPFSSFIEIAYIDSSFVLVKTEFNDLILLDMKKYHLFLFAEKCKIDSDSLFYHNFDQSDSNNSNDSNKFIKIITNEKISLFQIPQTDSSDQKSFRLISNDIMKSGKKFAWCDYDKCVYRFT